MSDAIRSIVTTVPGIFRGLANFVSSLANGIFGETATKEEKKVDTYLAAPPQIRATANSSQYTNTVRSQATFVNVAPAPVMHTYQRQQYEQQYPSIASSYSSSYSSSSSSSIPSPANELYAVGYARAKAASEQAKYTPPVSSGRGAELITEEKPWHPGKRRAFGSYKCTCGSHWSSAYSYADETQNCKDCGNKVLPHKQRPLDQNPDPEKLVKPHMQELCGKCQKLGRLCTLSMERSSKPDHPNDVVVKGLPQDITEARLMEIFRAYGSIQRVYLPEPKPEFSSRIAFLTFQNPEYAVQKFNAVEVPVYKQKPEY